MSNIKAWFWQDKTQRPSFYGVLILRQLIEGVTHDTIPVEIRGSACCGFHEIETKKPNPLPSIQNWLSASASNHPHSRVFAAESAATKDISRPESLYVIDCRNLCIEKVNAYSIDAEYAALSYVWGLVQQLTLTSKNQQILQRKGALHRDSVELPSTITDAMDFCLSIGIRYLWVDALCIVQDDEETKMMHINSMDNIYRRALVTIVAASGTDSNGGLPAFHYETFEAPQSICLRNYHFSVWRTNWSDYSPPKPRWRTRAWTFQEEVLSDRKIIFTRDRIFCTGPFQNLVYDYIIHDLIETVESKEPHFVQFTPGTSLVGSSPLPHVKFQEHLEQFLQRDISHNSDNLNAFTGIIRLFEPDIGRCWFGMPLRAFAYFSLFTVTQPRGWVPGFPTWSWACWKSTGSSSVWPNVFEVVSTVQFYRFDSTSLLVPLPFMDFGFKVVKPWELHLVPPPSSKELSRVTQPDIPNISRLHLLVFWAWELTFYVHMSSFRPGEWLVFKSKEDHEDDFIGCVDVESSMVPNPDRKYTFVLYAVNSNAKLKPVLVEKTGEVVRRSNICHEWKMSLGGWMALKPERKLIIMA
jgi:hypothetical protein